MIWNKTAVSSPPVGAVVLGWWVALKPFNDSPRFRAVKYTGITDGFEEWSLWDECWSAECWSSDEVRAPNFWAEVGDPTRSTIDGDHEVLREGVRDGRFDLAIIDGAPVRFSAEQVETAFLDKYKDFYITFTEGKSS